MYVTDQLEKGIKQAQRLLSEPKFKGIASGVIKEFEKMIRDLTTAKFSHDSFVTKTKEMKAAVKSGEAKVSEMASNIASKEEQIVTLQTKIAKFHVQADEVKRERDLASQEKVVSEEIMKKVEEASKVLNKEMGIAKKKHDVDAAALNKDNSILLEKQSDLHAIKEGVEKKEKDINSREIQSEKTVKAANELKKQVQKEALIVAISKEYVATIEKTLVHSLEQVKKERASLRATIKNQQTIKLNIDKEIADLEVAKMSAFKRESVLDKQKRSLNLLIEGIENDKKTLKVRELRLNKLIKEKDLEQELKELEKHS